MELITQLPTELAALADPASRAAAPWLRSTGPPGETAPVSPPFELCLALLTAAVPAGESWPDTGKPLPAAPLAGRLAAQAPELGASPASAFFALPPANAAALQAPPVLAESPNHSAAQPAEPPLRPLMPQPQQAPIAAQPLPLEAPAAAAGAADAGRAPIQPAAALAELGAVPPQLPAQRAPSEGGRAPAAWLDAFATNDGEARRPAPQVPVDARTPAPGVTADLQHSARRSSLAAAAPVGELTAALAPRRGPGGPSIATAVGGSESAGLTRPEWLPPSGAPATSGAAAPTTGSQGPPADLRSPNGQETFANRVQWVVDQRAGEAHIKLNPPELGAVDVKVSLVDDKTYVQLTAATAAARDELAQSLPRLRELLNVSGLELGGASVEDGRGREAAHREGSSAPEPPAFASFAELADDVPAASARRPLGRIDVFA